MSQSPYADEAAAAAAFNIPTEMPARPYFEPPPEDSASYVEAEPQRPSEPPPAPTPDTEPIPEFDPQHRKPFIGLLYLGALTEQFTLFGHEFVMSTPSQAEFLQIGMVTEPYLTTVTSDMAYATARVAAYLVSVDGTKLPEPISDNPKDIALLQRFNWVTANIRRPVINKLFDKALELEDKVDKALAAMGKA